MEKKKKKKKKKKAASALADKPASENEEEVRRFNPKIELQLKDALAIKKDAVVGEEIKTALEMPGDFGRMAAQTAKQVIIQKLRETERETIFQEFKQRE